MAKDARLNGDDDEWEPRMVRKPKGTHRPKSSDTDGADRELLYDDLTGGLRGPTESRPMDEYERSLYLSPEYEPDPSERSGGQELTPAQRDAADALAWFFERIVMDIGVPFFKSFVGPVVEQKFNEWSKRIEAKGKERANRTKRTATGATAPADPSTDVETAASGPEIEMTRDQLRMALSATLANEKRLAMQKDVLRRARVQDDDLAPELKEAIQLVLEGKVASVDEEALAAVLEFLEEGEDLDEQSLPNQEEVKKPKHLTTGDE